MTPGSDPEARAARRRHDARGFTGTDSRLGFTTWQSACRSVGISPRSLLVFTVELLPTAVIGALAGGLLVQLGGVLARGRCRGAQSALAAHGGCVLGMLAGLVFCALGLSWPIAAAAEALLAMGLAAWLFGRMPFPARASVLPRSQGPSSAY
jgi:hypothetical protein